MASREKRWAVWWSMPKAGIMASRMPGRAISPVYCKGMSKSAGVLLAVVGTDMDWVSPRSRPKSTPRAGQVMSASGKAGKPNDADERSTQSTTRGSGSQVGDADRELSAVGGVAVVEAEVVVVVERAAAEAAEEAKKSKGSETEKSKSTKVSIAELEAGSLQLV
jgi:hypothetical protein